MAERRFARLRAGSLTEHPGSVAVPDDGMCLSAFLVVRPEGRSGEVLLGRLDPSADWATIGGLDPGRVAQVGNRWMLPSSQLLFFESPTEAAGRIAREQLGVPLPGLTGPVTFSEAYRRPGSAGDPHWDLHFVYEARWPTARFPAARPFAELAFVEAARTSRTEIARSQADILALVGLATGP
ncbi:MAG: hypothetical protein WAK40_01215 [Thermoplasmata archaeon]